MWPRAGSAPRAGGRHLPGPRPCFGARRPRIIPTDRPAHPAACLPSLGEAIARALPTAATRREPAVLEIGDVSGSRVIGSAYLRGSTSATRTPGRPEVMIRSRSPRAAVAADDEPGRHGYAGALPAPGPPSTPTSRTAWQACWRGKHIGSTRQPGPAAPARAQPQALAGAARIRPGPGGPGPRRPRRASLARPRMRLRRPGPGVRTRRPPALTGSGRVGTQHP